MKTILWTLVTAVLCCPPARAFHCQPKERDWNDARTIALSESLPEDLYVARCYGTIIDFQYPSCMHFDNIYDGVPCPPEVGALAVVLRAEDGIVEAPTPPADADGKRALLSDAQKERLLGRIKKEAEKQAGGGDYSSPSAAPWAGAYRLKDGTVKMDVGGSMAMETWSCRLVRGRQCFAGVTAGKETVGLAIGFGLRSAAAIEATAEGRTRWQIVPSVGFVVPYASSGAQAAPCLGVSLKIW